MLKCDHLIPKSPSFTWFLSEDYHQTPHTSAIVLGILNTSVLSALFSNNAFLKILLQMNSLIDILRLFE